MSIEIVTLTGEQTKDIESKLEAHDNKHITYRIPGTVSIGVMQDGALIAGAVGCMTAFKIFYLSTVYIEEGRRRRGIGSALMECVEARAAALGATMVRLDTFDWQGAEFYKKLGYEQVGQYESKEDGFSEHFFLKRL